MLQNHSLLLGESAPPALFAWTPKNLVAPPAGVTFDNVGANSIDTTIDGVTTFKQPLLNNEIPWGKPARREHNFCVEPDVVTWSLISGAVVNGDQVDLPGSFSGVSNNSIIPSGTAAGRAWWCLCELEGDGTIDLTIRTSDVTESVLREVTLSGTPTVFAIKIEVATSTATGIDLQFRKNATSTTTFIKSGYVDVVEGQNGNSNPPDHVAFGTFYNASDRTKQIPSIRWYGTANGNTYVDNGGQEVTFQTGAALASVGYAPASNTFDQLNANVNYPAGGWHGYVEATGPAAPGGVGVGDVALGSTSGTPIPIYMAGTGLISTNTNGRTLQLAGSDWLSALKRVAVTTPDAIGGNLILAATNETTSLGTTSSEQELPIALHRTNTSQFTGVIHDVFVKEGGLTQQQLEDLVAPP